VFLPLMIMEKIITIANLVSRSKLTLKLIISLALHIPCPEVLYIAVLEKQLEAI
jgi:hypothetical protein